MDIDKNALDAFITASPEYPDAQATCPQCGRWECATATNVVCDLGDMAKCPECGHDFIVTEDNLLTLAEGEAE